MGNSKLSSCCILSREAMGIVTVMFMKMQGPIVCRHLDGVVSRAPRIEIILSRQALLRTGSARAATGRTCIGISARGCPRHLQ